MPQNQKCVRLDLVKTVVCSSGCMLGMCQSGGWQCHLAKGPTAAQSLRISQKERADQTRDHLGNTQLHK